MKIKSNKKKESPSFLTKSLNVLKDSLPNRNIIRTIFIIVFVLVSYFSWDYSGLFSFYFMILAGISFFLVDEGFGSLFRFSIVIALVLASLGMFDAYSRTGKPLNVKYSKIQFTDSTEKIVIFMESPKKDVIVIQLPSNKYYAVKDIGKDFNISIIETKHFNHYQYLEGADRTIDEYTYSFSIKANEFAFTNKDWKRTKEKLF